MNLQVIKNRILFWLKKIILYSLYFLLLFFLLSFGILQIPPVQKTILKYYTDRFSNVSGFKTSFQSVHLIWYDRFQINGLNITDPEENVMIEAEQLNVNFRISSLLTGSNVNIDAATLDGTQVNLVKIMDLDSTKDLNINLFIKRLAKPKAKATQTTAKVNVGEILINRSYFSYNDSDKDSLAPKFDYSHFRLQLDDGLIQNFKVIGDTIQFKVNSLYAKDEQTQFEIKHLNTFFRISQSSMEFLNINLDAGNSHVQDTVIFSYKSMRDLNDFNNTVQIKANIKASTLDPRDLALFTSGMDKIKEPIKASGQFTGKVNRFFVRNLSLQIGNTSFTGNLNMDGMPSISETFINLNLKQGNVDINDLAFLFPSKTFAGLKPLGKFQLMGNFTGFVNDFVANGSFKGKFGQIQSDVNLKINSENPALSQYKGNIKMIDFKLGTYLSDTSFLKSVSLTGHIDGKGFTEAAADFVLDGAISHFKIKNYDYKNIVTKARFKSQFFSGQLTINDPNLKFDAEGSIDFSKDNELVRMKARLDTALLHNLGFSKEKFFLQSVIDIDSKGLNIDSIFGQAFLRNTKIIYRNESLEIDSIQITSSEIEKGRSLLLRSTFADINLHGEYYYSTLFNDLNKLFKEFYLTIKNDRSELETYYLTKAKTSQEYDANFNIILHDINPLIQVAGINTKLSKGTHIEGKFSNGFTSIFNAYTTIDSIIYDGKLFTQNTIEFNGSKIRDSTNILAMLTVLSKEQKLSKNFNTSDLMLEAIWATDHIEVGLDFDQSGKDNYGRLKASIDLLNDSTRIKILPSKIKALNEFWEVNQQNYTLLAGGEWRINHLEIKNNNQSILLKGNISRDPSKSLFLNIDNLDLGFLNNISGERFTGTLNGAAEARDLYNNPYIQNDLRIKALTINDFLIGDINGVNIWNQQDERFDINFSIDRLKIRTVDLKGFYTPSEPEPLRINAQFNQANLKIAEPLLETIFSNMDGTLTGKYLISGSFLNPKINGNGNIENGQIMINYLKTLYNFTGEFGMKSDQLIFKDFKISDIFKNTGSLDGYIAHRNFREFRLNLDAAFNNLQLLNTTTKDNSLFYGQGYATGSANFFGPSENLKISATAKTEKNTRIFIPMSSTETVQKKDFINFVHFTDSSSMIDDKDIKRKKRTNTATGISMDINLDITPDAYTEIIFDIKSGDIIRGRGNGEIKLQLDTKGDFFMFGAVEFTQGAYNFTLYDIINKEFDIQPGSRISWYGNPYEGVMDITANYRQMASLSPILTDQSEEVIANSQVRRKYPTDVILKLEGQMLSPRINFDIDANELPDNIIVEGRAPVRLNFEFESFKAKLDEQELKRQVFSLIILRKFSPPDAFSTSGTLYNSVSELLSNQLSYWLTQVDQNLEIDLDLGTLDQEAFNTFQLRLSYSFLNGRLRVTRDGSFSNQYNASDNISTLAGDWTVDYLLTPDGKFKVKMYSRSNINQLTNTLGTQSAVTTGVSLLHTQNFNEIKDLWKSARDKNQNEKMINPPNEEALKEEDDGEN